MRWVLWVNSCLRRSISTRLLRNMSCDISEALRTMDCDTPQVEECCSMVSLTLIGQGVSKIGRVLPDSVLAWALLWFPGRAGNKDQSPWVQLRQNTFLLAMLLEKPYRFGSCSLNYSILAWSLLSFIVTTRGVSKYQRILCFMTVRNTWIRYHYVCDMV